MKNPRPYNTAFKNPTSEATPATGKKPFQNPPKKNSDRLGSAPHTKTKIHLIKKKKPITKNIHNNKTDNRSTRDLGGLSRKISNKHEIAKKCNTRLWEDPLRKDTGKEKTCSRLNPIFFTIQDTHKRTPPATPQ